MNSLTEKYKANAYLMTYGGVNLWVKITYNVETVYYSDAKSYFSMEWKDEDTLFTINEEPEYPSSNRGMNRKRNLSRKRFCLSKLVNESRVCDLLSILITHVSPIGCISIRTVLNNLVILLNSAGGFQENYWR